jgi:hypothetical protein
MSNINKEYGKIYPSELQNFTNDYLVRNQLGGFLATKNYWSFSEYLNSKNKAYIIHKFYCNRIETGSVDFNMTYHTPKYIIDNYGNIYNTGQTNEYQNVSCLKFLKASDNRIFSYDQMHPYATYNNKLSNKSIKIIKCIDSCSEDCMINLIKILFENDEENNKVLEDTNKDLLLKINEMKEKHNELVNKLMDRIADLTPKN